MDDLNIVHTTTPNYYSSTNWPISNDYLKQRNSLADLLNANKTNSDGLVECQLIDYFKDVSKLLKNEDQRRRWNDYVSHVQKNIISNPKLSSFDKVSHVAFDLNRYLSNNTDLKTLLFFENLGDFGLLKDVVIVGFDIAIDNVFNEATKLESTLVSTISTAFNNDTQNLTIIKPLLSDISTILKSNTSFITQQSQIYDVIKEFFDKNTNSDLKKKIDEIEIEDFGSFDFYFGVIIWVNTFFFFKYFFSF